MEDLIEQYKQLQSDIYKHKSEAKETQRIADECRNRLIITLNKAEKILDEIDKRIQQCNDNSSDEFIDVENFTPVDNTENIAQNVLSNRQETAENDNIQNINAVQVNVSQENDNNDADNENEDNQLSQEEEVNEEAGIEVEEELGEYEKPWLLEVEAIKSPYIPQKGDDIVYFKKGHKKYVEAIHKKKLYQIDERLDAPWRFMEIKDKEFVRVVKISYSQPPLGVCVLSLECLDDNGRPTKKTFTITYRDIKGVSDFLVLREIYEESLKKTWKSYDRVKCAMDNMWYIGTVINVYDSLEFQNIEVFWDKDNEVDHLSRWELEPLDNSTLPKDHNGTLPMHYRETYKYNVKSDEWPSVGRDRTCLYIIHNIVKLEEELENEFYTRPYFDLRTDSSYRKEAAYPIDLTIIKERLSNCFYRRLSSLEFDINYLNANVQEINRGYIKLQTSSKKSLESLKLCDLMHKILMKIIQTPEKIDVKQLYYDLAHLDDPAESIADTQSSYQPESVDCSQSEYCPKNLPITLTKKRRSMLEWEIACTQLLHDLWNEEDSLPFRAPVDEKEYRDYRKVIAVPMSLQLIKEDLDTGCYKNPKEFDRDMSLIFKNSRRYNTDKNSKIYKMTENLEKMYKKRIEGILDAWQNTKKKGILSLKKNSPRKQTRSIVDMNLEDEEYSIPSKRRKNNDADINEAGPSGIQNNCATVSKRKDGNDENYMSSRRKLPKKNLIRDDESDNDNDGIVNDKDEDDCDRVNQEPRLIRQRKRTRISSYETELYSGDEEFQDKNPKRVQNVRQANDINYKRKRCLSLSNSTVSTTTPDDVMDCLLDMERQNIFPPAPAPAPAPKQINKIPIQFTTMEDMRSITPNRIHKSIIGRVKGEPTYKDGYTKQRTEYELLAIYLECENEMTVHVKAWHNLARKFDNSLKKGQVVKITHTFPKISRYNHGTAPYEFTITHNTEIFVISKKTGKSRKIKTV